MARQFSDSQTIVVTNCTRRKRASTPPVSIGPVPGRETLTGFAKRWTTALLRAPRGSIAEELYVGRAMVEAKSAARLLGADLFVVSAGLGLVHMSDLVPNYDLTVSSETGPLQSALEASRGSIANWWSLLTSESVAKGSLSDLAEAVPNRHVLLALSASYLRLVVEDLARIADTRNLRILTSTAGVAEVPVRLRACVLPYDERLESVEGYGGTRSDFPQRAMRHFVEVLGGHELSLRRARSAVVAALDGLQFRAIPTRKRKTDAQIARLIRQRWNACGGSSTRLHRYLRDEALVACEQSRFRSLWHEVKAERQIREEMTRVA